MNFQKDKWEKHLIESITSDIEYGITASAKEKGNVILLRITDIKENGGLNNRFKFYTSDKKVKSKYLLSQNDILVARSGATAGKSYIHKTNGEFIFGSYLLRIKLIQQKVLPDYFYYFLNSNSYWKQLNKIKIGTAQPNINTTNLKTLELFIPSLKEQQQIVHLFQSIDNAIEQTEVQAAHLLKLRTQIVHDLLKSEPQFGDLLNGKTLSQETLGSVSKEVRVSCKNPVEAGIEYFVGLEHITPGEFQLNGKKNIAEGTTFTKTFEAGDVLFGKRRAYLKKAAIADFHGLCSSDILVLRSIDEKILKDLFPFYISANVVFDFAVSNSAGSLSPRAKWKDLSKFEFLLPDLTTQKKIVAVLQQIENTRQLCITQTQTLKQLKQKLLDDILG